MLNKKILAAAIAATLSTGAQAVDFTSTPVGAPTIFASELATLNSDGLLVVDGTAAADVSATFEAGFTIGAGTSKYIRIDLQGGEFTANSAPDLNIAVAGATVSLSQGGTAGDTFAVFEVAAPAGTDIEASEDITLESAEYAISETFGVLAGTYEFAADAVNENNLLASTVGTVAVISAGSDGEFAIAGVSVATVASRFEEFGASTLASGTAAQTKLGQITPSEVLLDNRGVVIPSYNADGTLTVAADFYSDPQDVTITGDFSFGDFTLTAGTTCGTDNTFDIDDTDAGSITLENVDMDNYSFCVTPYNDLTDDVVIEKGNYVLDLEDGFSDLLGTIVYDTLSIEVPYLTTFSEYNQRVYLINNGTQDADYSMTFTSEGDTDAEAGILASGTIPAGEMVVLRATDLVTLDGKTRTSATIEVSGSEANISASMQTVNLETGTTDTVVLNANSITEFNDPAL